MDLLHHVPRREGVGTTIVQDTYPLMGAAKLATPAVGRVGGLGEEGCEYINDLPTYVARLERRRVFDKKNSSNERLLQLISVATQVAILIGFIGISSFRGGVKGLPVNSPCGRFNTIGLGSEVGFMTMMVWQDARN